MDPFTLIIGAIAIMNVLGGFMKAFQSRAAGTAAKAAGDYQNTLAMNRAKSMDIQASEERAASQRRMYEASRQGKLAAGRARALAAASGADASSVDVINTIGDIETEAQYRSDIAKYQGEQAGRGLEYQAVLERSAGENARYAGQVQDRLAKLRAMNDIMSGFASGGQAAAGAIGAMPSQPSYSMGGFQTTPLGANYGNGTAGSALYQKYGQGGFNSSVYP